MREKETLQTIIKNNYAIPKGYSAYEAVQKVAQNLRCADADIRDEYTYGILYMWLYEQRILERAEYQQFMNIILDEKILLGQGIDTFFEDTETALMEIKSECQKAFVPLLYCLILGRHQKNGFLKEEQIIKLYQQVLVFLSAETNALSFHQEYGWIHIYAHIADLCLNLAQQEEIQKNEVEEMIKQFLVMIRKASQMFEGAEEERISRMICECIQLNKITTSEVESMFENELMVARLQTYPRVGFQALKIVGRTVALELLSQDIDITDSWQALEEKVNGRLA